MARLRHRPPPTSPLPPPGSSYHWLSTAEEPSSLLQTPITPPHLRPSLLTRSYPPLYKTRCLPLLSGHLASDLSEFSPGTTARRKKKEKRSDNLDAQRGRAPCSFPRGKLKQREIRLRAGLFSWISFFLENQLRALHLMYKNHLFTSNIKTMMISGLRIKRIACLFVRRWRNLLVLGVEALQQGSYNLSFWYHTAFNPSTNCCTGTRTKALKKKGKSPLESVSVYGCSCLRVIEPWTHGRRRSRTRRTRTRGTHSR